MIGINGYDRYKRASKNEKIFFFEKKENMGNQQTGLIMQQPYYPKDFMRKPAFSHVQGTAQTEHIYYSFDGFAHCKHCFLNLGVESSLTRSSEMIWARHRNSCKQFLVKFVPVEVQQLENEFSVLTYLRNKRVLPHNAKEWYVEYYENFGHKFNGHYVGNWKKGADNIVSPLHFNALEGGCQNESWGRMYRELSEYAERCKEYNLSVSVTINICHCCIIFYCYEDLNDFLVRICSVLSIKPKEEEEAEAKAVAAIVVASAPPLLPPPYSDIVSDEVVSDYVGYA